MVLSDRQREASLPSTQGLGAAGQEEVGGWRRPYAVVTGGGGFLGSHMVDRLVLEGYEVTVIDNFFTGNRANLCAHASSPLVHTITHDVRESMLALSLPSFFATESANGTSAGVASRVTKPTFGAATTVATNGGEDASSEARPRDNGPHVDCIFHFACPAAPRHYQADPVFTTMTCVQGTYHVLQLATHHSCPVVIASTSEVYGEPEEHPQKEGYHGNVSCTGIRACYDEGKRCAESLAFDFHRQYGTKVRVARIFNTYGPRMTFDDGRVISNFVLNALQGTPLVVYGDGSQTRSLQYVSDLVEALWRFMRHPSETGPLNLGNPDERSVSQIAENVLSTVEEVVGSSSDSIITYGPAVPDDPTHRLPDITHAHRLLDGWAPSIPLQVGLAHTVHDFQSRLQKARL